MLFPLPSISPKFGLLHVVLSRKDGPQHKPVDEVTDAAVEALGLPGKGVQVFTFEDEDGRQQKEPVFVGKNPEGFVVLTNGKRRWGTDSVDKAIKKALAPVIPGGLLNWFETSETGWRYDVFDRLQPSLPVPNIVSAVKEKTGLLTGLLKWFQQPATKAEPEAKPEPLTLVVGSFTKDNPFIAGGDNEVYDLCHQYNPNGTFIRSFEELYDF